MLFHTKQIVLPVDVSVVRKELARKKFSTFFVRFAGGGQYEVFSYSTSWVFNDDPGGPFYPINSKLVVSGNENETSLKLHSGLRLELLFLLIIAFFVGYMLRDAKGDVFLIYLLVAPVLLLWRQDVLFKQSRRLNLDVCDYFTVKYTREEN